MEIESNTIKGSKNTKKFLENFSCINCRELGYYPYVLICDHVCCENCIVYLEMKKNDGSLKCPYCGIETKKNEILPELDVKLLIYNLNSMDDEEFYKKYKSKLNYINENNNNQKLRNIIKFLLKFNSFEYKRHIKNNGNKKICKRTYADLQKETYSHNRDKINEPTFQNKPIFKYC